MRQSQNSTLNHTGNVCGRGGADRHALFHRRLRTLTSTAKHLGLDEDARTLKDITDEMKFADEQMTRLADEKANNWASTGG